MPSTPRVIVIAIASATILVIGLLVGAFGLSSLNRAEATDPTQMAEPDEGWSVQSFRTVTFAEESWNQIGQKGSCVAFSSQPPRDLDRRGRHIPAAVTMVTQTEEFIREYPLRGARVLVCAGFTIFMSPLNFGLPP